MKKKILLGALFVFLPFKVNAANISLSVNCEKTTLVPGEETKCTLDGEVSDGSISGFETHFDYDDNIKITNFVKSSIFSGSVELEEKYISLYTEGESITGKFNIGTLYLTAPNNVSAMSYITFNDSIFGVNTTDNVIDEAITIDSVVITIASNDLLRSITVNGKILEDFDPNKYFYEIELNEEFASIMITTDPDQVVFINGLVPNNKLNYGDNEFVITVSNVTGLKKDYTIKINRPEIREIKKLFWDDSSLNVDSGVYEHTLRMSKKVSSIDFDAELENDSLVDFVEGFGPRKVDNLVEGENTILFKTVDKNGEVLTYTINVIIPGDGEETTTNKKEENKTENKTENKKDEVKNPETGVNVSAMVVLSLSIISIACYIVLRKNNYFKKI